jgi:hypothetical protein
MTPPLRKVVFALLAMAACGAREEAAARGASRSPTGISSTPSLVVPPPIAPVRSPACLPVGRCAVFAAPACVRVTFSSTGGPPVDDSGHPLDVRVIYPGLADADPSVATLFDFVDRDPDCAPRPPAKAPPFACAADPDRCAVAP